MLFLLRGSDRGHAWCRGVTAPVQTQPANVQAADVSVEHHEFSKNIAMHAGKRNRKRPARLGQLPAAFLGDSLPPVVNESVWHGDCPQGQCATANAHGRTPLTKWQDRFPRNAQSSSSRRLCFAASPKVPFTASPPASFSASANCSTVPNSGSVTLCVPAL